MDGRHDRNIYLGELKKKIMLGVSDGRNKSIHVIGICKNGADLAI